MNFKELSARVATDMFIKKTLAEEIVKNVFETIENEVANGGEVSIHGFGRFTIRHAAARNGRNINTGEMIDVPARAVPKFVPHTALKEAVKNS